MFFHRFDSTNSERRSQSGALTLFFAFAACFFSSALLEADEPAYESAGTPEPDRLELVESDSLVTGAVNFGAVRPKEGFGVVLKFNARIVTERHSGWNPYMTFRLNGKTLDKRTETGSYRLLRRGTYMATDSRVGDIEWWRNGSSGPALMTFFAPRGTEELDYRIKNAREEGFTYWLDLSDAVHYLTLGADDRVESDEPNRLEIDYLLTNQMTQQDGLVLDVSQIELLYLPLEEIRTLSGSRMPPFEPGTGAATLQGDGFSLQVNETGGMEFSIGGENFYIESFYSYPAEPRMAFNRLGIGESEGWTVKVERPDESRAAVTAEGNGLKLERTLVSEVGRIRVTDKLSNIGANDTATRWYTLLSANAAPAGGYRLAGQSGADRVDAFGTRNPTVFVKKERASLGAVVEDTISRAQLFLEAVDHHLRFGSRGLGLPAGKTVTIEWTLYPATDGDYYDFINTVRRDWGVNRTIPGPLLFRVNPTLAEFGCRPQMASVPPWHQYAAGASWSNERFRDEILPKIAEARKLFPDIILLGMIETNLVPFDASAYEKSGLFPLTYGDRGNPKSRYGMTVSKEASEILDAESDLSDSMLRDKAGNAIIDTYYGYSKKPWFNLMVQPEEGNRRFAQMLAQIDFLMDECGFDGIYIDQFQPSPRDGFREDRSDGYTVELAPNGTVARTRYSYAITGASARGAILRHIAEKGGIVLTNGQPSTREERESGVLCFQEMENDPVNPLDYMDRKPPEFPWETVSHLGTPVTLGLRPVRLQSASAEPSRWGEIINKGIITALRNGSLYYYYGTEMLPNGKTPPAGSYELGNRMFPFTPRELHEGWVYGDERLITAVSGTFRLHGANRPLCYRFDRLGLPTDEKMPTVTGEPENWSVEVKIDDWNETAVLVVQ